jgi:hypothetical protein
MHVIDGDLPVDVVTEEIERIVGRAAA